MREIKFRIWLHRGWPDKEYEMAEVDYYFFEEWGYQTSGEVESAGHKLMQFTGLKDKNEKEIYEGDIVAFWNRTWSVECPGLAYGCYLKDELEGRKLDSGFDGILEVIGNIYENPELIKKEKA